MRSIKLFTVAVALFIGASSFAYPPYGTDRPTGSNDLKEILDNCPLAIEKDVTVIVRFTLTEKHEVQVHSVKSENEKLNEFFKKKLEHQKLKGPQWYVGKLYEVPVKVQPKRQ